jgi:GNAT superfamily N-acetyltransferase
MAAPETSIRAAHPGEVGALTALAVRSKAHWGYDAAFMQGVLPELTVTTATLDEHAVFVAEHPRGIAGFYVLGLEEGVPTLRDLWIDPPAMGLGVGRQLWAHMLQQARARGYRTVRIDSDPNAEGFYLKMGARRVGQVESKVVKGRFLPVLAVDP